MADYWSCFVVNHDAIRTVMLLVVGVLGIGLAGWRTWTVHRQANTAEKNLLNEQFGSGVELLGHENVTVRLGGIETLNEMAELYPEILYARVMNLFQTFLTYSPVSGSDQGGHKRGEVDYGSQDIVKIIEIINAKTPEQRARYQLHFASTAPFTITDEGEIAHNPDHQDWNRWIWEEMHHRSELARQTQQDAAAEAAAQADQAQGVKRDTDNT